MHWTVAVPITKYPLPKLQRCMPLLLLMNKDTRSSTKHDGRQEKMRQIFIYETARQRQRKVATVGAALWLFGSKQEILPCSHTSVIIIHSGLDFRPPSPPSSWAAVPSLSQLIDLLSQLTGPRSTASSSVSVTGQPHSACHFSAWARPWILMDNMLRTSTA